MILFLIDYIHYHTYLPNRFKIIFLPTQKNLRIHLIQYCSKNSIVIKGNILKATFSLKWIWVEEHRTYAYLQECKNLRLNRQAFYLYSFSFLERCHSILLNPLNC